jgi:hypothetical protein
MGIWGSIKKYADKATDYVPGVSNVKGAIQGDWAQAIGGPGNELVKDLTGKDLGDLAKEVAPKTPNIGGEIDALGADAETARAQRAQFADALAGHQAQPVMQVRAPTSTRVESARAPDLSGPAAQVQAQQVQGARVQAPGSVAAPQLAPVAGVTGARIDGAVMARPQSAQVAGVAPMAQATAGAMQAAKLGHAARTITGGMSSATVDPAILAQAQQAQAAQIATNPQAQMREGQSRLVTDLQSAAAGTGGPSAAQAMLQQGMDRAIAAQFAQAAAARGSNVGLAQREAAINASSMSTNAALEAAKLRAQEQQQARQELAGALGGARGQDIGLATSQADLTQGANLANLDAATRVGLANAAAQNQRGLAQAQLEQEAARTNLDTATQVGLANTAAQNQFALQGAQFRQDAAGRNLDADTRTGLANMEATNAGRLRQADIMSAANLATLDANTRIGLANTAAQNQRSLAQAELDQSANLFTAGAQNQQTLEGARMRLAADQGNQQTGLTVGVQDAQLAQQAGLANQSAALTAEQANAAAQNAREDLRAKLGVDVSQFNAQQANQLRGQLMDIEARIATANASNDLEARRIAEQERQNLRSAILASTSQSIDANTAAINAKTGLAQAQNQNTATLLSAGATLAPLLSDEDRKEMIRKLPADDGDFRDLFEAITPHSYRYKDPAEPGAAKGDRWGILAGRLEKGGRIGASLVERREDGARQVNVPQAVGATLAALGILNKRLERIEKRAR